MLTAFFNTVGLPKLFVVFNPCQSSPSLTMLVPLWFKIIFWEFIYLSKLLFSGFLQFKGNFANGQNTSKYRDRAPLTGPKDSQYGGEGKREGGVGGQ